MVSALELREIESLENELAPIAGRGGGDYRTRLQYLQLVRKHKLRRSELVAKYGLEILNNRGDRFKLGNEVWTVYEQVALAAMDCNSLAVAKECVGALLKRFPDSLRVGRLEGMWLEANERWDQAERLYDELLEDHPNEASLHKRKIAMLKARGDIAGAVGALNAFLETYMADMDAWRELAEMYATLQMYRQAAFCYEEILLTAPTNPIYNVLYAELLYTMGGIDNLRTSRKYYAAAVQYSGGANMRALHGICLASAAIREATRGARGKGSDDDSSELPGLAAESILRVYREQCPDKLKIAASALSKLGLKP